MKDIERTPGRRINPENPETPGETTTEVWFQSGEWKAGWDKTPDQTINPGLLALHYQRNRERWEMAFEYLARTDLSALETGRIRLLGDDLFLIVDEYTTRNEENSRFEAHRIYADIQYLVHGEEKIGVVPLAGTEIVIPYCHDSDIMFLSSPENNYRLADPSGFFIFFPEDAHRPCVKTSHNMTVRKIVVKVKLT